jgi:phosphate transport system substrate-binding protein
MAEKVKSTPGSIGYDEVRYIDEYHVAAGSVLNPAGRYVKASAQSLLAACRAVEGEGWNKLAVSLTDAPGAESYPITSFTWIYVRKPSDSTRGVALTDFLSWVYGDGQQLAVRQGYPQLPAALLTAIKAKAVSLR